MKAPRLGEGIAELSKPSGPSMASGSNPNGMLLRPNDSSEYASGSGSLGITILVTGGTRGENSAGRFRPYLLAQRRTQTTIAATSMLVFRRRF